ncbi:transmembrane protein 39A [Planococcus citri]|uniref:transmembrane protein 39A n=1 Tax=Planococcus citri TaxID=170843 RepID=UPI0031F7FEF8
MPPGKRHFSRASIHPTRIQTSNVITTPPEEKTEKPEKTKKLCTNCIGEVLHEIVPVHIPVPMSSSENYLVSEFLIALFSVACGFVQYFNIYQNAWWLPHSYHHYGLNLHLIDWFIVQFIIVMTLRPSIFSIVRIYVMKLISKFESNRNLSPCIRMILSFIFTGYGVYCGMYIWWIYGFVMLSIMYLPWVLYMYIYSSNIREYFDLRVVHLPSAGFIKGILVHRCTNSSQRSRDEVDFLRADFNARMKCLLFNSFTNAYYCVYIPACFSQGFLYFEDSWVSYFIILMWFSCICVYLTQYFSFNYYDACHRAALHLGKWGKVTKVNGKTSYFVWFEGSFWYKGIIVKHNGNLWRAENLTNSAEPGNRAHEYFYRCFGKPGFLIYCWVLMTLSVCCLQFVFLMCSNQWNHILAACMMLTCSYYSLYKCIKSYKLSDTLYKLEEQVQTKMIK